MINYMDRIALSIAAKPIAAEFNLSSVAMGYLFSSFIWSYALFLIPMGFLADRFGTKRIAGIGIFVWSAATVLTGATMSFASLMAARLVMGAGESSSNPVGAKVIRQWIPAGERGLFNALFNSGSYAGPAICSVLLGALVAAFGWRVSFVIAGGIGFVWLAAWLMFFNTPEKTRWLPEAERHKIIQERDTGGAKNTTQEAHGLLALMRTKTLWGIALTQGCNVYTQYLLLTWLPSYLQATKHLTMTKTGVFTAVPYAVSVVLCIFVGSLSDRLLRKSGSVTGGRRKGVALTMLTGAVILAVPYVNNIALLVAILSISLTGIASTTSLNFALLNDLLPSSNDIAKAMAFVVVGGNIFGMAAPIVTGYVVASTGNYDWAFVIAGTLLLAGMVVTLTMTRRPMIAPPSDKHLVRSIA
jgi:ACS family glucarate transporter-like MFS transporter